MNIYMNYPFTINGECMFDRCVTSEIDNDTFGFLLVRKHDEKIASTFVFFDYVRMQKIDDGIEILYRSADLWDCQHFSGQNSKQIQYFPQTYPCQGGAVVILSPRVSAKKYYRLP